MGLIAWGPLKSGYLAGKYTRDMKTSPPDTRLEALDKIGFNANSLAKTDEYTWSVVDAVKEVAQKIGKSPSQVIISSYFITSSCFYDNH